MKASTEKLTYHPSQNASGQIFYGALSQVDEGSTAIICMQLQSALRAARDIAETDYNGLDREEVITKQIALYCTIIFHTLSRAALFFGDKEDMREFLKDVSEALNPDLPNSPLLNSIRIMEEKLFENGIARPESGDQSEPE
jgi:hypothetical protein